MDFTSYLPVENGFATGKWATRVRRRVIFIDFLLDAGVRRGSGWNICGATFGGVRVARQAATSMG
jgi:hypothetical protein